MSTANTRVKHWRSVMGTLVCVLTFALVIGGIALVPARGEERERRHGQEEHGRRERERHDERGQERERRHGQEEHGRRERERHDERGRQAYSPYGYYAPPPVVYPPAPSPGINLFFHIP